jgi:catalase
MYPLYLNLNKNVEITKKSSESCSFSSVIFVEIVWQFYVSLPAIEELIYFMADEININEHSKDQNLAPDIENSQDQYLTTDQGVRISHTDDTLKAGERGPTLVQDFHFREKITHFDHERIPERVVHARGAGAHGYFQVYEPMAEYTKASFLQDPSERTPVFVRFSTVAGFRGSFDTARDVRGFATKFYTKEGNYDLVGNNIPVFFIQDAIKFPDVIHAVKPEPHNEIPQAQTAHDTAWDFFSLTPETTHMVLWTMSDRAIPRSFRMMEGFGVNTFRFVNAQGRSHFVKFHWKPLLGVHSLVWDEAHKLGGIDPDFHRRDLWEAIEMGDYPEYEFGVQLIPEEDQFAYAFDILDPTKIWPEELIPVRRIGKMTLNRNPDNFFAETEQVAFHTANVVPGIDFSDDPLLQGRNFSYLDTQLNRFGGTNFSEIPINRPVAPVHNNQRDGFMRQTINKGRASYYPNSLDKGYPVMAPENESFVHYPEQVEGRKIAVRSETFKDYFSQATLFWRSLSPAEQQHVVDACRFELGQVKSIQVREREVALLDHVDHDLAVRVAEGIGVTVPKDNPRPGVLPPSGRRTVERSPALSMDNSIKNSIKSRLVAFLVADGVNRAELETVKKSLEAQGAHVHLIARTLGTVKSADGQMLAVDKSAPTVASVQYDAVFIPGGQESVNQLLKMGEALHFVAEAYKHFKPIGATGTGVDFLRRNGMPGLSIGEARTDGGVNNSYGIVTMSNASNLDAFTKEFSTAIAQHRHWIRPNHEQVPA